MKTDCALFSSQERSKIAFLPPIIVSVQQENGVFCERKKEISATSLWQRFYCFFLLTLWIQTVPGSFSLSWRHIPGISLLSGRNVKDNSPDAHSLLAALLEGRTDAWWVVKVTGQVKWGEWEVGGRVKTVRDGCCHVSWLLVKICRKHFLPLIEKTKSGKQTAGVVPGALDSIMQLWRDRGMTAALFSLKCLHSQASNGDRTRKDRSRKSTSVPSCFLCLESVLTPLASPL